MSIESKEVEKNLYTNIYGIIINLHTFQSIPMECRKRGYVNMKKDNKFPPKLLPFPQNVGRPHLHLENFYFSMI